MTDDLVFAGRQEAGIILGDALVEKRLSLKDPLVLGIPRGGLPVGFSIAKLLKCPLDAIVLRKLPLPGNPEAGFGAVTLDKTVVFNQPLIEQQFLSEGDIKKIVEKVYKEVLRRNKVFRGSKEFPELTGRTVIITDDGLATGFTMLAAIDYCRKKRARDIIVAVPVAHVEAYQMIKKSADFLVSLHVSEQAYFGVASFYETFPEMTDQEVLFFLENQDWIKKE